MIKYSVSRLFFCREIFLKNNFFLAGWVLVAVQAFL